jgi:hypothetical protein
VLRKRWIFRLGATGDIDRLSVRLGAYEQDATGKSIGLVPPSDQGGALFSPVQIPSSVLGRRRVSLCASGVRLLGVRGGSLPHLLLLVLSDT